MTIHSKICKATFSLNKASMRPEAKEERPTLNQDCRTHGRIKTEKKHFYALRVFKEINQVLLNVFRKPLMSTKRRTTGWLISLKSDAKWASNWNSLPPRCTGRIVITLSVAEIMSRRSNDFKSALEKTGFHHQRTRAGSMFFGLKLKNDALSAEPF